ncbi:MAG TPA: hypothetical protein VF405_01750, partial [Gammaproteobacteria bacterium]
SYDSPPERDHAPPAPHAEQVEAEQPRSAPRDEWAPQERSFGDAPRDASAEASTGEPAPAASDERQAS